MQRYNLEIPLKLPNLRLGSEASALTNLGDLVTSGFAITNLSHRPNWVLEFELLFLYVLEFCLLGLYRDTFGTLNSIATGYRNLPHLMKSGGGDDASDFLESMTET